MTEIIWLIGIKAAAKNSFLIQLVPFVAIFVLFYFLIIRPQKKRDQDHRGLLGRLKKGDKVLTTSGIFGEIYALTPDAVVLEIASKVKVTFQRSAIAGIATPGGIQDNSSFDDSSKKKKKK